MPICLLVLVQRSSSGVRTRGILVVLGRWLQNGIEMVRLGQVIVSVPYMFLLQ